MARAFSSAAVAGLIAICFDSGAASTPIGPRQVPGPDSLYPRIEYADGLVSLNDRCMVKLSKLNPNVRPVYVNGQPVGFC